EDWDVMKGRELHVPRGALPETEDDAFYAEDLVGLTAHHPGGEKIGEIRAVQNFGASDLLEILPETSDQTVFIPLTEEDVPEIDLKTGRVIVASYSLWTEGGDDGPDGSSEDGDADGADEGDGGA
ncbi:MAG: ribosome maturation factor RimM, partial [Pseudomonadota bacterium]